MSKGNSVEDCVPKERLASPGRHNHKILLTYVVQPRIASPVFFFPHWTAYMDGQTDRIWTCDGYANASEQCHHGDADHLMHCPCPWHISSLQYCHHNKNKHDGTTARTLDTATYGCFRQRQSRIQTVRCLSHLALRAFAFASLVGMGYRQPPKQRSVLRSQHGCQKSPVSSPILVGRVSTSAHL